MNRYELTDADRTKSVQVRQVAHYEGREARRMRRTAELVLLDRLYTELAMPEWYPHQ